MIDPPAVHHPERALAVAYAPPAVRHALATLFALDERLGGIVARTTEPTIGLMRLVWWRDALAALDGAAPPPAEPLLIAAARLADAGIAGADLAAMSEGWEALLDDPDLAAGAVGVHARERGARLFALAGRLLGGGGVERIAAAGEGWARVDLARHLTDQTRAGEVLASARPALDRANAGGWRRPMRPLGMLALLAASDTRRGIGRLHAPASPSRLLRILAHQLTGR